jgi:hypothetical protein
MSDDAAIYQGTYQPENRMIRRPPLSSARPRN